MRFRKIGAYTLIELFVVVLLLGALVAISLPNYVSSLEKNREKVAVANAKSIANAIQLLYVRANHRGYDAAGINKATVAKEMGEPAIPTNPCTGGNHLGKDYNLSLSAVSAKLEPEEGTLCEDANLPSITLIGA